MFSRGSRRLIDRLKCHDASFTGQLRSNLEPQSVEFLFDHGNVGTGCTDIGPRPAVVVHIHNRIQTSSGDHVDNVRDTL